LSPAGSQLEQYLARSSSDPVVLVTALLVAFFLGAAHALTPGHGKTIVAAYLVGSRGRLIDAVYLGAAVTITHTFSVFILGIVTLYASQQVSLDKIYPWLSLASGVLVMLIGAWLVFVRLRGSGASMVHSHGGYSHAHANYGAGHSHSSIVSLGVSGGLVPCPEALVVLMLSVSLRKVALGLGLLAAFSLGLAAVLIAIGCMMVLAGPLMSRVAGESRFTRSLPVVSACVVTVLGIVMVLQAARTL
jgi:ABC-type nickel/cobalt efflux system permease component RcnA